MLVHEFDNTNIQCIIFAGNTKYYGQMALDLNLVYGRSKEVQKYTFLNSKCLTLSMGTCTLKLKFP